ncbi:MAG: hypothetical protein KY455_09355 [Euryarchaeota archaeon]|nr:hypothetical protein [Euryarchaeota archaeon]
MEQTAAAKAGVPGAAPLGPWYVFVTVCAKATGDAINSTIIASTHPFLQSLVHFSSIGNTTRSIAGSWRHRAYRYFCLAVKNGHEHAFRWVDLITIPSAENRLREIAAPTLRQRQEEPAMAFPPE